MDHEVVIIPMQRREIDYAKEAVEERRARDSDNSELSFNTLRTLRKSADAPKAED